jgi:DNA-binding transcriptional ArsR family regulator
VPRAATTSDVFNAIAEPRRRDILVLLADREQPVGAIGDALSLPQPSVSKHLRVLRDVGLVDVRRDGRQALYRTNAASLRPVQEWTQQFERYWTTKLARIKARATAPVSEQHTLTITQEILVRSSPDATFAALLEEMGPQNLGDNGTPMPMVLEAWPGGRWFRDLGEGRGHFWGHVQAIKAPALLEICGPLMISSPVLSNVQYRLTAVAGGTAIAFRHTAFGLFPDGFREGLGEGWTELHTRLRRRLGEA